MRRIFGVTIGLVLSITVYAEGYQVNFQSARQLGMGHTGTGLSLGATSIHFNPGALGMMKKDTEISGGISAIMTNNTFQKEGSLYKAETDNPVSPPFYLYGAKRLSDKWVAGIGVTTTYGNKLVWDENWDGRFLIQDIALKAIYLQPTISYKITDAISVGAGFQIAYGNVKLHKAINLQSAAGEGQVEIKGTTFSYGYNVGVFAKALPNLTLGLNYRSTIIMTMKEGEASFKVPASLVAQFPDTKFRAEMPMPGNLTFGAGWNVTDKLLIAADLQYIQWSEYKELAFDFENEKIPDTSSKRNFENTFTYRIGAEYLFCDKLTARVGFAYDSTPIPENYLVPETPGADKLNYTFGATYHITERLSMDASLLIIESVERTDGYAPENFYGTYNSNGLIPALGINYSF